MCERLRRHLRFALSNSGKIRAMERSDCLSLSVNQYFSPLEFSCC